MPYTANETITPFWAEYSSEASGRDPLALQNSSVVIYSKMIVGITNVTNRIRYNGFYCWIFDTIARSIGKNNSLFEQIRYTRRAELLLAFVMVKNFPDKAGVSGSSYATRNLRSDINLSKGADWEYRNKDGSGLYWKLKSGIFGQYFVGVMRDLDLIHYPQEELNIYSRTKKGLELSKAFSKNIPKAERDLFWQCVYEGNASEDQLTALKSFALHIIPEGSDERIFYESMLLAADDNKTEPTYHRSNTIKLILQYLKDKPEGVEALTFSFLKENFKQHSALKSLEFDTATSWYLFELNEILHVAYEHFHTCFLYSMQPYPEPIDDCILSLTEKVDQAFKNDKNVSKANSIGKLIKILEKLNEDVYEYYGDMEKAFKAKDYGECLKNAVNTILSVYLGNKHHIVSLSEFADLPENNFNRRGYAIELIQELAEAKMNLSIEEYIKSVLINAINLHTFSSYTKSRVGQSLVHNYLIEDNMVWRLRETLPSRTSPRLQNAIQYITDIGWLKQEGKNSKITESGIKILQ